MNWREKTIRKILKLRIWIINLPTQGKNSKRLRITWRAMLKWSLGWTSNLMRSPASVAVLSRNSSVSLQPASNRHSPRSSNWPPPASSRLSPQLSKWPVNCRHPQTAGRTLSRGVHHIVGRTFPAHWWIHLHLSLLLLLRQFAGTRVWTLPH